MIYTCAVTDKIVACGRGLNISYSRRDSTSPDSWTTILAFQAHMKDDNRLQKIYLKGLFHLRIITLRGTSLHLPEKRRAVRNARRPSRHRGGRKRLQDIWHE